MKKFLREWPLLLLPAIVMLTYMWGYSSSTGPEGNQNSALKPAVDSVSPSRGMPEIDITLIGNGFGEQTGKVVLSDNRFEIMDWNDTTVVFTLPEAISPGYRKPRLVTTSYDSIPFLIIVESILIDSIRPEHVNPGDPVNIYGNDFGSKTGYVLLDDTKPYVTSWKNDLITFIAPDIYGICQVEIRKDYLFSNLVEYVIGYTQIDSIVPARSIPGGYVDIHGRFLLLEDTLVSLGAYKPDILNATNNSISIGLPEMIPTGAYQIEIGDKSHKDINLDVVPFEINSIVPSEAFLGQEIQLFGSFYGTDNTYVTDRRIRFGSSDYFSISRENWSDTLISFHLGGSVQSGSVNLRYGNLNSNVKHFRLKKIQIDSIRPEIGRVHMISRIYGDDSGISPGQVFCGEDSLQVLSWDDDVIEVRVLENIQTDGLKVQKYASESNSVHYEVAQDTVFDLYDCNQVKVEISLYCQREEIFYEECDTFYTTLEYDLGSDGEAGWKYTRKIVWYNEHFSLDTATLNDPDLNPERLMKWLTGIISTDQTVLDSLYIHNWKYGDGYDRNYSYRTEKRAVLENLDLHKTDPVAEVIIFRAKGPEAENALSAFKWFTYGTEYGSPFLQAQNSRYHIRQPRISSRGYCHILAGMM